MKLPEPLARVFSQERSQDPITSARALYDLEGHLGETYVAADDRGLMLFSRPLGGTSVRHALSWPEIHQASLRSEGCFAFLDLRTTQGAFILQFSPWEALTLERMVGMWRTQGGRPPASVPAPTRPAPETPPAPAGESPCLLSPMVAFCAAMQTMLHCDGQVEQAELEFIAQRIPDPTAIQAGQLFLQEHGKAALFKQLGKALSDAQKGCLMANLIAVAMVDGVLQSEEQELLDRFQTVLQIPPETQQALFSALMTKNNMAIFAHSETTVQVPDADGLTPLLAYCASLLAMMACDKEILPAEKELLTLSVPYPEEISLGRDYLMAYGLEHLLRRLDAALGRPQKRCLMANLIALVMVDGVIHSSEQELIDRFKMALKLTDQDYSALYDVLLLKNNLAVLADAPASPER